MALVSLNAVRKSFGSRTVLDDLDFAIEPGARVGVVGANGSGKSTMLKLIAGIEEPDAGTSVRRRGLVVSFLPQHPLGDERNALETVLAARPDLDELDRDLHRVAEQLASPELAADLDKMSRVLRRQEELVERWEAAGGPSIDGRARAMLLELGLEEADLTLPTQRALGRPAQADRARSLPRPGSGRAAPRRAGGPPRRRRPLAARAPARDASTAPPSPSRTTATCSTRR